LTHQISYLVLYCAVYTRDQCVSKRAPMLEGATWVNRKPLTVRLLYYLQDKKNL